MPHIDSELHLHRLPYPLAKHLEDLLQRRGEGDRLPLEHVVEGDDPRALFAQAISDGVVVGAVYAAHGGEHTVLFGRLEVEAPH